MLASGLVIGAVRTAAPNAPAARAAAQDPFHALLAHSRDLGPLPQGQRVSLVALLRDPAVRRQAAKLSAIYNRKSPAFRRYPTLAQWVDGSASLRRTVGQVQDVLSRAGLAVSWKPGNDWLAVSGPARAVEREFRVRVHGYVNPSSGRRYYAALHTPIVPRSVASMLSAGRIFSYPDRVADILPVEGLRPTDLLTAYDIGPLRARGFNGSGVTIAFIEIDGFRQSDLDSFTQHFGLAAAHPTTDVSAPFLKVEGEADLDLQVAHEIAPKARLVVYDCSSSCSDSDLLQLESQAVQANPRGIISISLGGCETAEGSSEVQAESSSFAQADALGETVLVASGDSGGYTCLEQDWGAAPSPQYIGVSSPASGPNVTAVGGTSLSLTAGSSWYREEAWQNAPATVGSGGGVSAYFARPSWQHGPGVVNSLDATNRREVPDISADADPLTSAQVVINGQLTQAGGTSQAAPIWAGMMALIDQYLRRSGHSPAGFLNPALYALAASHPVHRPLHDVTVGDNLLYPATPGYDLATGLGTPDAWNLARDLAAYEGNKR
jgi:kumamolisin